MNHHLLPYSKKLKYIFKIKKVTVITEIITAICTIKKMKYKQVFPMV